MGAVDASSPIALHRQLEGQLRRAIADGTLAPGTPLAGTRSLASDLGVARITVATAYDQLVAEGYLEAEPRRGTRVARKLPSAGFKPSRASGDSSPISWPPTNAWAPATPVTMGEPPPTIEIDLGPERFSLASLDVHRWERRLVAAWRELARDTEGGLVSYFGGLGDEVLRRALAGHLAVHRGVRAGPDSIAITAGSTAAFSAVARVWLGPGRRCVIEDPGGSQLRRSLASSGADLIPVPVDDDGLDPERLPDRADVAFVTPSWQYPNGGRMPLARRLALLAWARVTGCIIIEDDCESELRYAGDPLPTLQGLGEDGQVIYVNTFSKVLFPGLRTGYAVIPDGHRGALLAALEAGGRPPSAVEQRTLGRFVESGAYLRHVRRLRGTIAGRRSAFVEAVGQASGGALTVRPGGAGGHLIMELGPALPGAEAFAERAAGAGVRIEPLTANRVRPDPSDRAIVIYLTRASTAELIDAARRLGALAVEDATAVLAPLPNQAPIERLRATGDLEPARSDLKDLAEPLPLAPGQESPSSILERLRRDER